MCADTGVPSTTAANGQRRVSMRCGPEMRRATLLHTTSRQIYRRLSVSWLLIQETYHSRTKSLSLQNSANPVVEDPDQVVVSDLAHCLCARIIEDYQSVGR
jgi:hypothetical protein